MEKETSKIPLGRGVQEARLKAIQRCYIPKAIRNNARFTIGDSGRLICVKKGNVGP